MKWMRRILISLVVLGILCVGGYLSYNTAYAKGEVAGYDSGYPEGHKIGYSSGKQDGYGEGYASGKKDGYDAGYGSGKKEGYSEGYVSGKTDGYTDGYDKGMATGLGHGYTIKDPTHKEAIAFLSQDKTDRNKYVEDTYVCAHFARDVCNNAEAQGLRCAFVVLRYLQGGNFIVAFNTIDKGLVYFEAITDERAKPVIGKRYYQCVEPEPGYYYTEPSYDDTIMDILVIW